MQYGAITDISSLSPVYSALGSSVSRPVIVFVVYSLIPNYFSHGHNGDLPLQKRKGTHLWNFSEMDPRELSSYLFVGNCILSAVIFAYLTCARCNFYCTCERVPFIEYIIVR